MPNLEMNQAAAKPSLKELLASVDLISPEELASALKIARTTAYQWVRRGVIPHLKLEGVVRFSPDDIREWLTSKRRAATKAPGGASREYGET